MYRDQTTTAWAFLKKNKDNVFLVQSFNVENAGINSEGEVFITPKIGTGKIVSIENGNNFYLSVFGNS